MKKIFAIAILAIFLTGPANAGHRSLERALPLGGIGALLGFGFGGGKGAAIGGATGLALGILGNRYVDRRHYSRNPYREPFYGSPRERRGWRDRNRNRFRNRYYQPRRFRPSRTLYPLRCKTIRRGRLVIGRSCYYADGVWRNFR